MDLRQVCYEQFICNVVDEEHICVRYTATDYKLTPILKFVVILKQKSVKALI